jgi:hypothetical protein
MQRRAAAVYFTLFVVVGAGAYGFLGIMSQPPVELEGPTYDQGEELRTGGVTYTVDSIGDGEATLTWLNATAGEEQSVDVEQGENSTLGGTQYFAHFPEDGGVQILPSDEYWGAYQDELDVQDQYQERRAGVWAILFMSFLAAIILISAALMPLRG